MSSNMFDSFIPVDPARTPDEVAAALLESQDEAALDAAMTASYEADHIAQPAARAMDRSKIALVTADPVSTTGLVPLADLKPILTTGFSEVEERMAGAAVLTADLSKENQSQMMIGTMAGASMSMAYTPTDPGVVNQFYIDATGVGELDLNVTEVWPEFTGAGVRVAVLDDGVDNVHEDLAANYNYGGEWDFRDDDWSAQHVNPDEAHGTAVAGIIAMADNDVGGVGVAYGSTVAGFRVHTVVTADGMNQIAEGIATASGQINPHIPSVDHTMDVVNMSLGTAIGGTFYDAWGFGDAPWIAINSALVNGVAIGRGGLGTIYVKSAGNARAADQDSNTESWGANPATISVAAVNRDGTLSTYSTQGANLLISGFGTPLAGEMYTTDRTGADGYDLGNYTFGFNGTSAAAPTITGVVALMLDANEGLAWRDVQEILGYSARHVGTDIGAGVSGAETSAWQFNASNTWNGGGLHHSRDYGFGLADAHAAVRMAEVWTDITGAAQTSANWQIASSDFIDADETVDGFAGGGVTATTVGTESYVIAQIQNIRLQHISLELDFSTTYIGDMEITITSPSGTTATLVSRVGTGSFGSSQDFDGRWVFAANAFWGETSAGNWTVTFNDASASDTWLIRDAVLHLGGKTLTDNDHFVFTNEFSDYAGIFGHSTSFVGGLGSRDTLNAVAVTSDSTINLLDGLGVVDGVAITLATMEDIYSGDGDDQLVGNNIANILSGGRGRDTLFGENGHDTIYGGFGADQLIGGQGVDHLYGGVSNDRLWGGDTADYLYGGDGADMLSGDGGSDNMWGDLGNDTMYGGVSGDTMYGGTDDDEMYGGDGNDYMSGDVHNDVMYGGNQNDVMQGNSGNDTMHGDAGVDDLNGGAGDDFLYGGADNDRMTGGANNDVFYGGQGADRMIGGTGADSFVFTTASDSTATGAGRDVIVGFVSGEDKIDVSALQAGMSFIGSAAFTGVAGQIRYLPTSVAFIDLDGDTVADMSFALAGAPTLLSTDFIFA
ncbi:MAG: S8 family serine peptidase [Gemmobacter sp.]|nr:S8 family serine peptidase [Gemmobacter sp.]